MSINVISCCIYTRNTMFIALSLELTVLSNACTVSQGLTSRFAEQVLERDGPNELKPPKGTPEYVKFARQLAGGLQCLMWVAAVICFIAFGIECAKGEIGSYDNVRMKTFYTVTLNHTPAVLIFIV